MNSGVVWNWSDMRALGLAEIFGGDTALDQPIGALQIA